MHTKLTIPERLKDLRVVEKKLSLQELADATGIPSSTLQIPAHLTMHSAMN